MLVEQALFPLISSYPTFSASTIESIAYVDIGDRLTDKRKENMYTNYVHRRIMGGKREHPRV